MYKIHYDPKDGILHLVLEGFWTMETVDAFKAEMHTARKEIARTSATYDVLSNSPKFPVQSTEVSRGLAEIGKEGRAMGERRTAFVVASSLNKLQVGRTFSNPDVGIFLTEKEATDWLKAGRD